MLIASYLPVGEGELPARGYAAVHYLQVLTAQGAPRTLQDTWGCTREPREPPGAVGAGFGAPRGQSDPRFLREDVIGVSEESHPLTGN